MLLPLFLLLSEAVSLQNDQVGAAVAVQNQVSQDRVGAAQSQDLVGAAQSQDRVGAAQAVPVPPAQDQVGAANATGDKVDAMSMTNEECPLIDAAPFQLNQDDWWKCEEGDGLVCFNMALHQMRLGLNQPACHANPCYAQHLPEQLHNLHRLARTVHDFTRHLQTLRNEHKDDSEQRDATERKDDDIEKSACHPTRFHQAMELYANVLIQKARQCHLDFDVLQHLSQQLHGEAHLERACLLGEVRLGGDPVTTEADYFSKGGQFFYGMAVDGQPRGFFFPQPIKQTASNYTIAEYKQHLSDLNASYERLLALTQ